MLRDRLTKLRKTRMAQDQRGFTLVEVLVSIALLGIVAAGLFTGLGTTSKVLFNTDARETAKNLAETQMEYVKKQPFVLGAATYHAAPLPPEQSGYTATIAVVTGSALTPARDDNLQKIIVTISVAGITYTLEDYKVR